MNKILYLLLSFTILIGCATSKGQVQNRYPVIQPIPLLENHFGLETNDMYRRLENTEEKEITSWYSNQDSIAENYFIKSNGFVQLKEYFTKLYARETSYVYNQVISENGFIFYMDWNYDIGAYNMYYKENYTSAPVHLFHPGDYKDGESTIKYISPSKDGKSVAFAIGKEGDFDSEILVLDVKTKKLIGIPSPNAAPDFAGGIQWLPNNTQYIYLYFPNINGKMGKPVKEDSYSVVFDIMTDESKMIFGNSKSLPVSKDFYPIVKVSSEHLVGYIAHADKHWNSYILPIDSFEKDNWKSFFTESDNVLYDYGQIKNNTYYFLKNIDDNTSICSISLVNPSFEEVKILAVSDKEKQILRFEVLKDKLYFSRIQNGTLALLYEISKDVETKIELPFQAGTIKLHPQSINSNNLWVTLDGWTRSSARYKLTPLNELKKIAFGATAEYPEFEHIISEQLEVKSHDGKMIPLTIVRKKCNEGHHKKTRMTPTDYTNYWQYRSISRFNF